ncbi:MAG: response regulator [Lewinellaceae bacterium]|nr:response regulator [Lewinellaceae bacterium]
MLKDNAGNIWLGTFYGGAKVVLKHKKPFVNYQPVPGKPGSLEGNTINKLTERPDGSIWVPANGKGLALFDPWKETFRHIPGKTTATNNTDAVTFLGVLEDTDHNAWAITFNEIWKIDGRTGQWKNMKPSGMPSKGIWLLMQFKDSGGTHWIGTQGGLYSYDHKANAMIWHSLNSNNQVKEQGNNANIQDIFESPNGDLWVATYGGANRLKRGSRQFEYFPFHRHILCIHRDNNDVIWFGTVDGMAYFNATSGKVEFYPKAGSLRGQVVHSILEDNLGRFWFGTGTGILCFDPISCLAREYNQKDGVVNRQFFGTHLRSKTGEFYFGGTKGLLRFHPDSIRDNAFIPPIVLTNFQILNKDMPIRGSPGDTLRWKSPLKTNITYTENINLPYWQNDFAFEFAALDFTAPLNNRYKFRLEGYDTSWVETSAERRFAHYTNISPGTYTFTVLGSNSDGKWNETGASVRIVVNPPWYTTWWASLFYFVAFIGLLLSIRRFELNRQSVKAEARRLEELDAVKSRLYTNITHEFRTPLTIILGLAEQLKASASESVKTGLDMIYRNGQRVLQLVNQMLDLAKVESGHLKLDLVQGDVVVYMKYLLESFHSLAENKHMRLHFRADITTLLMDFDPERLQTVVSNLLSNALKFTPEGGDVYFMITQIEENRVPQLQLKVRDTGPGIPEETLPYIFDRFYQSDDSAIRSADGTGIGLTLTRELVKLMQGQISAKSPVPGNTGGTEFTVVLPVLRTAPIQSGLPDSRPATPASAVRPASGSSGQPSNKPLVLLVEDNPDVVRYLQTCLHSGYRIETTFDGVQGIEKALESVPDLIISDVMMPRKDGFEVCRVLKNDERTSHIPIILLTAKADIESRLVGLKRGADAYLAKPFHKEELLVRIYNLLEVRRRLQTHYLTLAGLKEGEMPPGMVVPEHEMEDAFIQKVRELIEADFSVQWQVPELAHKLLVSTTQLHRKLAALTGMHTTEFVRHVRLTKASQLLRSKPDERISAIASESGFENVNEFNRRFKEVFGMPPGEWRKGMG